MGKQYKAITPEQLYEFDHIMHRVIDGNGDKYEFYTRSGEGEILDTGSYGSLLAKQQFSPHFAPHRISSLIESLGYNWRLRSENQASIAGMVGKVVSEIQVEGGSTGTYSGISPPEAAQLGALAAIAALGDMAKPTGHINESVFQQSLHKIKQRILPTNMHIEEA